MALYLTEADVDALLAPEDALEAVEGSFVRMAEGVVDNRPRYRHRLDGGQLAVMSAADLGLRIAGIKTYAAGQGGASFVIVFLHRGVAFLANRWHGLGVAIKGEPHVILRDGRLSFDLGHVPAGQSYILFMQFQVNPTNIALNRPQDVRLFDGKTLVLTIHRSVTIFP